MSIHDATTRHPQRYWEEVDIGETIPQVTLEVPYTRVIHNIAATWDYYPGHHDAAYAQSQGQPTIYISTLFFQGFVDRVMCDWGGPRTFVMRRTIKMTGSVFAGDTMHGDGVVTNHVTTDSGGHLVDADIEVRTGDGVKCVAQVTVDLPVRGEAPRRVLGPERRE